MKIISWNVNGLRAAGRKGFVDYLGQCGADLVFLQETKANKEQLSGDLVSVPGWGVDFHSGKRKWR